MNKVDLKALWEAFDNSSLSSSGVQLPPTTFRALLEELGALRELVSKYESAARNPGNDQRHLGTSVATQLVHAQHMRELAEAERDKLRAEAEDAKKALDSRDLICNALMSELGPQRTLRAMGFEMNRITQAKQEIAEGKTILLKDLITEVTITLKKNE